MSISNVVDVLISTAIKRTVEIPDVGLEDATPERVREFCDTFSRRLVDRYLGGELSWSQADAEINDIFCANG